MVCARLIMIVKVYCMLTVGPEMMFNCLSNTTLNTFFKRKHHVYVYKQLCLKLPRADRVHNLHAIIHTHNTQEQSLANPGAVLNCCGSNLKCSKLLKFW